MQERAGQVASISFYVSRPVETTAVVKTFGDLLAMTPPTSEVTGALETWMTGWDGAFRQFHQQGASAALDSTASGFTLEISFESP